jgi:hypothetical protein
VQRLDAREGYGEKEVEGLMKMLLVLVVALADADTARDAFDDGTGLGTSSSLLSFLLLLAAAVVVVLVLAERFVLEVEGTSDWLMRIPRATLSARASTFKDLMIIVTIRL